MDNVFEPDLQEAVKGADHPYRGKWHAEVFGNDNPITLELGCGKGEYTVGLARKWPNRNFVGVDIKGHRFWRGAKTANQDGLSNVAFLRTRIEFIDQFFGPGEVADIWLTFSDPQPKDEKGTKRITSGKVHRALPQVFGARGLGQGQVGQQAPLRPVQGGLPSGRVSVPARFGRRLRGLPGHRGRRPARRVGDQDVLRAALVGRRQEHPLHGNRSSGVVKDTHDDRSFEQDVYDVVRAIPEGRVTSYGAIAKVLGAARASRRVGWVLNKSFGAQPPVPAHRVVNRLGMLTGAIHFPADQPMAAQLEAEGVVIENDTVVDFGARFWDPMTEL